MNLTNKNIIHTKIEDVEIIQFKKLLEYDDILFHCFTLKPLNFGSFKLWEENRKKILDEYSKICNVFDVNLNQIVRPKQTHTDIVKVVEESDGIFTDELNNVDALITDKSKKFLSLVFADCMPILLFDPLKKVIGNVHSGWKGTVQRIAEKAVNKMIKEFDCNPKDIICCIGPTIRSCHFQVEDDVKDIFESAFEIDKYITSVEKKDGKNKYNIDAVAINVDMLLNCGLKKENIIDSGICSFCNSDKIHSFRVDKEFAGRNSGLIMLM